MVSFRRSLLLGILLMVFVVACRGTANTGTTSTSVGATMTAQTNYTQSGTANTGTTSASVGATMTAQTNNTQNGSQTNSNQNNQGGVQMTPTPTKTLISTKRVNVHGRMVTVLTTFHGMTLYERTSDPAPDSSCTGPCAHTWPPLLSNGTVMSTAPIGGALTVHMTANGKQVEYKGHPLYTYSGDMAPGQANGQGVGMVWQIVTVAHQRQHW